MPDLFEWAAAWLDGQRQAHATHIVTYHRGALSVEVSATIGRTLFEVDSGAGVLERIESRDYLIRTADLVLAGNAVFPERGDQIHETQGSQTFVYEVLAPAGKPPWRYSDPYRRVLRIHTKQVGTLP